MYGGGILHMDRRKTGTDNIVPRDFPQRVLILAFGCLQEIALPRFKYK
jgi:hypothetical protein